MHDPHHAVRPDFHVRSFQAQDNARTFRERTFCFYVAAAQTEIGQPALGNRLGIFRNKFRSASGYPASESLAKIFWKVRVANSRFAVGICPRDFAAEINVVTVIGKSESSADDGRRTKRLCSQDIQAILAQIKQNAFHLRAVLDLQPHRKLYRDTEGTATFTLNQSCGRSQAGLCLLLGNRLVDNEICACAKNVAHFGLVAE